MASVIEAEKADVGPVPEGHEGVTPHLAMRGAARGIEFLVEALGAEEVYRMPGPGGVIMHAELKLGRGRLFVSDEFPDWGTLGPEALGGSPVTMTLYVEDVDEVFERAIAAGATATMPPADMFWGDRYGKFVDPTGHRWAIATHVEDVAPDEMARRMAAMPDHDAGCSE